MIKIHLFSPPFRFYFHLHSFFVLHPYFQSILINSPYLLLFHLSFIPLSCLKFLLLRVSFFHHILKSFCGATLLPLYHYLLFRFSCFPTVPLTVLFKIFHFPIFHVLTQRQFLLSKLPFHFAFHSSKSPHNDFQNWQM